MAVSFIGGGNHGTLVKVMVFNATINNRSVISYPKKTTDPTSGK